MFHVLHACNCKEMWSYFHVLFDRTATHPSWSIDLIALSILPQHVLSETWGFCKLSEKWSWEGTPCIFLIYTQDTQKLASASSARQIVSVDAMECICMFMPFLFLSKSPMSNLHDHASYVACLKAKQRLRSWTVGHSNITYSLVHPLSCSSLTNLKLLHFLW